MIANGLGHQRSHVQVSTESNLYSVTFESDGELKHRPTTIATEASASTWRNVLPCSDTFLSSLCLKTSCSPEQIFSILLRHNFQDIPNTTLLFCFGGKDITLWQTYLFSWSRKFTLGIWKRGSGENRAQGCGWRGLYLWEVVNIMLTVPWGKPKCFQDTQVHPDKVPPQGSPKEILV